MEGQKKKGSWTQANLKTAVDKVLSKEMSIRNASTRYGIPKSTLHDKIKALEQGKEVQMEPKLGRFTQTFSEELENTLENHIKDLADRCMPLTKKEFLKLAFDLAEQLKIPHRFNMENKAAGKHFYYDFMKRHEDLRLRTAESTSLMRAVGFNKAQVVVFFKNLGHLIEKYKFTPSNIYNCDETGVTTVQKHAKILAKKNVRQVGKLTSAERGKNVTVVFCMSAMGYFTPPFFIFPRQRMNERLMINAPPESEGVAQPKGWMNNDFFLKWLTHFKKFSRPSKEAPMLLLVDGHSSHKTLEAINFCRDNNIHLISFPPHTTHKLQPLDRSFMKPFKNAYNEQCGMWMRANSGAKIIEYDIAGLVANAFKKVARYEIAQGGFRCTGIYPFDENIFSDLDYLASDITNIPLQDVAEELTENKKDVNVPLPMPTSCHSSKDQQWQRDSVSLNSSSSNKPEIPKFPLKPFLEDLDLPADTSYQILAPTTPQPSTSNGLDTQRISAHKSPQPSTSKGIDFIRKAILNISPVPDAAKKRAQTRKRKSEKSEILTSSPFKFNLEEKNKERTNKEEKKEERKRLRLMSGKGGKENKLTKAKTLEEIATPCTPQKTDVTSCVVCLEDHEEDWIQCSACKEWAHEACADIPECSDNYICDRCRLF